MTIFELMLMGHLFGDFVFQNKWMAMNKSANTLKCLVHCWIYTFSVLLFTTWAIKDWRWPLLIFISHFPIDRWSLADKWLKLINGRSLKDFMEHGHENIPQLNKYPIFCGYGGHWLEQQTKNYHTLRGGFTSIVYTVVDNTFHLALMWLGYYLIK